MNQGRRTTLALSLLTSVFVLGSMSEAGADVIFFANGRTLAIRDARISGETITVTLRHGGEATFATSLISHIAPGGEDDAEVTDITPTAAVPMDPPAQRVIGARPFAALIETISLRHGVDPALVHAVVEAESSYRPEARSQVGARGLMQVMPSTGRDLGVTSAARLFDPAANLEAGVKYLKSLLERFNGDVRSALAAYNAGPGAVTRYRGIPPYPETQHYVRKVLSNFQQ